MWVHVHEIITLFGPFEDFNTIYRHMPEECVADS